MTNPIRSYLPHILVGLSISLVMVGAYAAVGLASNASPKVIWSANPVSIRFSRTAGSGSSVVSFKCAPLITGVNYHVSVNNPTKVSLTASGPSNCGPTFGSLTLTARSTTSGTYSATVALL